MAAFLEGRYIRGGTVERRDYQVSLAAQAAGENCIVVLPTGLGKTAVALQVIAEYLRRGTGGILFLAPTRVLASQHHDFMREKLTIEDISLVTGADPAKKRERLWGNSLVCATPEIANNDLARGMIRAEQFSLVIFDEVHRTVGDYAYSGIAQRLEGTGTRVLGMTATLPSERAKATEILVRLGISSVAERSEQSPDVREYTQETVTERIKVDLPPEMVQVQRSLRRALDARYDMLGRNGIVVDHKSLSALLKVRQHVLSRERRSAKPLFAAIRIHHALAMLEAHGVTPFLRFCERARAKGGVGVRDLFEEDPDFAGAMSHARRAREAGIEHSKIPRLREIIESVPGKSLVFTSYRDSVDLIHSKLTEMGVTAGILIGKAGETGLKQKKQIETVRRFRDGEFRVLVATRVGEEGLDIAEVNQVIFYDNVPSSIRFVQRRGRTGRRSAGRLVVLIARNTIDETYHWIGHRKIGAARGMGQKMTRMLEGGPQGLDAFI